MSIGMIPRLYDNPEKKITFIYRDEKGTMSKMRDEWIGYITRTNWMGKHTRWDSERIGLLLPRIQRGNGNRKKVWKCVKSFDMKYKPYRIPTSTINFGSHGQAIYFGTAHCRPQPSRE